MTAPAADPPAPGLLPLAAYRTIVVGYSGGKDSLAALLRLFDLGAPRDRVELWHQHVDGDPDDPDHFMDWPCTPAYVRGTAELFGIRLVDGWRDGGFRRELLRRDERTAGVTYARDGRRVSLATVSGKPNTRRKFPQKSADLSVRWCSAALKIDVAARVLRNDPAYATGPILYVTGERAEESAARSRYRPVEPHRTNCRSRRVDAWRPVLDWPEARVWEVIGRWRVQPHPAYRVGFSRVSCATCVFGSPDQWATVRHVLPDHFRRIEAYETEFGVTIDQKRTVRQLADSGSVFPATLARPDLVRLLVGTAYPSATILIPAGQPWELPAGAFKRQGGPV